MAALILATLGCAGAQTATRTDSAPSASTTGNAARSGSPLKAPSMYTITLAPGHPANITAESLTIELLSVKDDRCPVGVSCIWAGHAAVTLQVSKPGMTTQTIAVGSEAPAHMRLPYDAAFGNYRLHLVKLEPGNTQSPTTAYRATISVSTRSPGQSMPEPNPSEM